ncbi:Leucine-rich repeat - like 10 [Theobroma cacao]|nr:Leucine-rich repeat - like 10 [Theobroma cacao]
MSSLSTLDLSKNHLLSRIPWWMGSTSILKQIAMADNHLEGPIPWEFCKLNHVLQFLDLSVNNISRSLPSCFKPLLINEVHLSKNRLQGPLPDAFRDNVLLVTLNLSYNHLTGTIPNWISRLSALSYLLLKRSHYEGEIPIQLCKLAQLSLIDLSHNNLFGGIPPYLKVTALNYLSNQYVHSLFTTSNGTKPLIEQPIEYTIKSVSYSYKKRNLAYMSGIDLSCNKLIGEIPYETEDFSQHFDRTNPTSALLPRANRKSSSYNNLSGNILLEIVKLHFLAFLMCYITTHLERHLKPLHKLEHLMKAAIWEILFFVANHCKRTAQQLNHHPQQRLQLATEKTMVQLTWMPFM